MAGATPGVVTTSMGRSPFLEGMWRLVDPKIALASLVPFLAGMRLAAIDSDSLPYRTYLFAFLAIFAVEVGKNAVNDLHDFRSGTDRLVRPEERSPFSGGKRVLVDGLLSERDLVRISIFAFSLAALLGIVAAHRLPGLFLLGVVAAAVAFEYTAPPLRLSYRGFGEAAVFVVYGPGILLGIYALGTGTIRAGAVVCSISLGLLIANVLLLNEIPDERADRLAGKRTLVVRLGRNGAVWLASLLFLAGFLTPVYAAVGGGPLRPLGLLLGFPIALAGILELIRTKEGPPVRAQALTLAGYVVAGVGVMI